MSEPITSGGAAVAASSSVVATASVVTMFAGLDAGVLYGALAGSTLFVVSSHDLGIRRRIVYMLLSTVLGVVCAQFFADLLAIGVHRFDSAVTVPPGVGAALAGATLVNTLLWIIERSRHPAESLQAGQEMWRGKR